MIFNEVAVTVTIRKGHSLHMELEDGSDGRCVKVLRVGEQSDLYGIIQSGDKILLINGARCMGRARMAQQRLEGMPGKVRVVIRRKVYRRLYYGLCWWTRPGTVVHQHA